MNPIAFESTLNHAFSLLEQSGGEVTPEIEELFAIVDTQRDAAMQSLANRRFSRDKKIAEINGRIAFLQSEIDSAKKEIEHEESVIKTADKYIIRLMDYILDNKGKPVSKITIDGQILKRTQGVSNVLVIDDETKIPAMYKRCKITIPADRYELVKMLLNDDEVKNVTIETNKSDIKKAPVQVQGTHIETTITEYIKRG